MSAPRALRRRQRVVDFGLFLLLRLEQTAEFAPCGLGFEPKHRPVYRDGPGFCTESRRFGGGAAPDDSRFRLQGARPIWLLASRVLVGGVATCRGEQALRECPCAPHSSLSLPRGRFD